MASQTKSSAWKLRSAIVEIGQLVFGAFQVKDKQLVHLDWPATYLGAMHEVTAVAFFVDLIGPLLFPVLDDHLEFNYGAEIGIASFGMIIGSFNVGLAWRYWWLSNARSNILAEPPTRASRFKKVTVLLLAVSSNLALCIWLVPNKTAPTLPAEMPVWTARSIGTLIFCLDAIILYGAYLGNLLEAQDTKMRDNVFVGIYGLFVIFPVLANSYYLLMSRRHEDGSDSEWFLQVVLVPWAVCLLLVYSFTPPEQPLVMTIDVAPASEVIERPTFFEHFHIKTLLNRPIEEGLIWPRFFLVATHEVLIVTLLITLSLTLGIPMLRPQIFDHPAKVVIGSINPCFAWDYFPASWIAVFCCSFNVYFSYRYAWLASLRRSLLRGAGEATWASSLSTLAAYCLALSSNLWLCLWLIGPNPEDPIGDIDGPEIFWWSLHTGIFFFFAGAEYFTYLGLLLDIHMSPRMECVTGMQQLFAAVYGSCCVYLFYVYGHNMAFHEKGSGVPALGSGFWTQVADIVWMTCVSSIPIFMPEEPPLRQKTKVLQISLSLDQESEVLNALSGA